MAGQNKFALAKAAPAPSLVRQDELGPALTIAELLVMYFEHAKIYYRQADGTVSPEVTNLEYAVRGMREMFGELPCHEFGPLKLKQVRQRMIDNELSRRHINARVNRIRRIFRWGGENELVSGLVVHQLNMLTGLRRGRGGVREAPPVKCVSLQVVEATIPFLPPRVAAIVKLLVYTAARTGEICNMRTCDLNMSGQVWIYKPAVHKTAYHGIERNIYLGPRAQEVLRPWLKHDAPSAYIFQPRESVDDRNGSLRARGITPSYPSYAARKLREQMARKRIHPPGDHYRTAAVRRAIERACQLAFPLPAPWAKEEDESMRLWQHRLTNEQKEQIKKWHKAQRWHPHQLRHLAATMLRKQFGIEVARLLCGHSSLAITLIYAEEDAQRAIEAMSKVG
jgi:integrase